jgi:quinol monooxygenase YgiN
MTGKIIFIVIILVQYLSSTLYSQTNVTNRTGIDSMAQIGKINYGQFGNLKAIDGKADELVSILLEAADVVSELQGCRIYIVSRDLNDENKIWIFEVWDSKKDHANSLQQDNVRQLISRAIPLIDGQPEGGVTLKVIGGTGLDERVRR